MQPKDPHARDGRRAVTLRIGGKVVTLLFKPEEYATVYELLGDLQGAAVKALRDGMQGLEA